MDEAAVFTIHGFCQRMLRQNAFESGAPLKPNFDRRQPAPAAGGERLLARRVLSGGSAPGPAVRRLWPSPAAPAAGDGNWLDNDRAGDPPGGGGRDPWRRGHVAMARIAAVKAGWLAQTDEIRRQTEGQISRYTGKNYEGGLPRLATGRRTRPVATSRPRSWSALASRRWRRTSRGAQCRPCRCSGR